MRGEHGIAHLSLHHHLYHHRWMLLGIAGVLGQPLVSGVVGHLVRTEYAWHEDGGVAAGVAALDPLLLVDDESNLGMGNV